jgi:hypothetical protein
MLFHNNKTQTNMAEENIQNDYAQEPALDDVDALRMLLYKVKGSSAVSSVPYKEIPGEQE